MNLITLIDAYHRDFPTGKVYLMTIPLCSKNGGLAANYGAANYVSDSSIMWRTIHQRNKMYIELSKETQYTSFVRVIPTCQEYDAANSSQQILKPVNVRSTVNEYVGTNGVHPSAEGYNQIADCVYRELTDL